MPVVHSGNSSRRKSVDALHSLPMISKSQWTLGFGIEVKSRACAINAVADFCVEDADCQCRIVPFSQAIPDLTSRPLLRVSAEPKEILK